MNDDAIHLTQYDLCYGRKTDRGDRHALLVNKPVPDMAIDAAFIVRPNQRNR